MEERWHPEGTGLFKDINTIPGTGSSMGGNRMVQVGNSLFFEADDGIHGGELWKTDGTPEGTWPLYDIAPALGAPGSAPASLTASGSRLFFVADEGEHGRELWSVKHAAFNPRP